MILLEPIEQFVSDSVTVPRMATVVLASNPIPAAMETNRERIEMKKKKHPAILGGSGKNLKCAWYALRNE